MKTPFSDVLEKKEGRQRFYAFRKRDENGYENAFSNVLNLLDWVNGQKKSILIVGPGTGQADVNPLVCAAKGIGITDKIELKLVEAHAVNGLLEQAIEAEIETSSEEADIAAWFRNARTEQYDLIIAMQVVQHFPDWRSLLCCLTNSLKDNGLFVFDHMDGDLLQAIQGQDDTPFATHFPENTYPKTAINYYRRREYVTGVFWDPEFVANRPYLLEKVLGRAGFKKTYVSGLLPSQRNVHKDDVISAFSGRGFGPLAWGKPLNSDTKEEGVLAEALREFGELGAIYSETGQCQLYCYQKQRDALDANLESILSNDVQGSFSAFSKLDKHLRHDLALDTELKREELRDRYIRTLMQCLLFSGAVNDSVAFIIPTFGHLEDLKGWKLKVGREQTILLREDQGDVFEQAFHNTVHSILSAEKEKFSEFIHQTMRLPIHFRVEESDSISVNIDHMHPCGTMLTVKMPSQSSEGSGACNSKFEVKHDRQFQQYQYGELKYDGHHDHDHDHADQEVANSESLIRNLKEALAEKLNGFMRNESESVSIIESLSHYLYSYAYLLGHYNVTIFGFYQVYPCRENPELSRDTTGLGLLVMGEVREEGRYIELKEAQRHLLYFMCREMASAMFFQAVGDITAKTEKERSKYEARIDTYERLRPQVSKLLEHLQAAETQAASVRAIVEPPPVAIIGAGEQTAKFFENNKSVQFSGRALMSSHEWKNVDFEKCLELVGASILTAMGINIVPEKVSSLWEYAKSMLRYPSPDYEELALALSCSIIKDANDDECFRRAVNCFHTPFKSGMNISAAFLVACFPRAYNNLKEHMNDRFTLAFGISPPDKINKIFELLAPFGGSEFDVKVTLPKGGEKKCPGSVNIKTINEKILCEPIDPRYWKDLKKVYGSSTKGHKGNWEDILFRYFGPQKDLVLDDSSLKVYLSENDSEYLVLKDNYRELNFLFSS